MAAAEELESIITKAVANAKQHNYNLEYLEDHEKSIGTFTEARPRVPSSNWTAAWNLLGLKNVPKDRPETKAVVLIIHGMNGHCSRPSQAYLAHKYYLQGYHPVSFDFQGHGYSDRFQPGTQNAYYDHTRALIDDYTELIDDTLWVINKLFVSEAEKRAALMEDIQLHSTTILSQYYQTHGGRKRKGRADWLEKADLDMPEGYNSETDDMMHDFYLRHRFNLGTPLFLSGTSMGGATALLVSSIMQKMKEAVNKAFAENSPEREDAIFKDMNSISLEDPRKKTIGGDSDDDDENKESYDGVDLDWGYDSEEEELGLVKGITRHFRKMRLFFQDEFSSVKSEVNKQVDEAQVRMKTAVAPIQAKVDRVKANVKTAVAPIQAKVDRVKANMKTAVAPIQAKVDRVKADVKAKVERVKADVDRQVQTVENHVKGRIMDVYEGRVGVHGQLSLVEEEEIASRANTEQHMGKGGSLSTTLDGTGPTGQRAATELLAGKDCGKLIYYNNNEYSREFMLHIAQVAQQSYQATTLISPACAVDTPHPALVAFLSYVAVPFFPAVAVPAFLRRNDDSAHWVSVNWRRYNNSDGYPEGLSWGANVKFRTAFTILQMIEAVRCEIPHINFPYLVIHDPLDKVTAFEGVISLMRMAGSARPEHAEYLRNLSKGETSNYIECERIKGGITKVPRKNHIGEVIAVPGGRHDILSNFTDEFLRHTLNYYETKLSECDNKLKVPTTSTQSGPRASAKRRRKS